MGMTDYWACSCGSYFDLFDLAREHSKHGHDVVSLEYRDGRNGRYKADAEREEQEEAA